MTLCAFLNQGGGHVLFGVRPDGSVAGQQVADRTIEALSAELSRIEPPAFPDIERAPVGGGREVVVVTASRGGFEAVHLPGRVLPPRREHDAGDVRRRVQPDAL